MPATLDCPCDAHCTDSCLCACHDEEGDWDNADPDEWGRAAEAAAKAASAAGRRDSERMRTTAPTTEGLDACRID